MKSPRLCQSPRHAAQWLGRALGMCLLALSCDREAASPSVEATQEPPRPSRCDDLLVRAHDEARAAWVFTRACDGALDERGKARLLSSIDGPTEALELMPLLGASPDRVGVARLIAGQVDTPPPEHIDDPSSAVVFPIDDAVLGQVGRAYRLLFAAGHPLSDRQWAHAYLAKVHLHALQSLPQQEPPSPAQTWLAARVVHHGRRAVANVERSPRSIRGFIHGLDGDVAELHRRLDAAEHHGDPLLLAVERQRYREQRGEPLRASDVDRLVAQGFGDWAVQLALALEQPGPWLELVEERARAEGLALRGLPEPEPELDDGTESTGSEAAVEIIEGPSVAEADAVARPLLERFDAARDPESRRIALADAAYVIRRRPDVAPLFSDRRDDLGALARRFLTSRGEETWALEYARDPEQRVRLEFAATRPESASPAGRPLAR